LRLIHRAVSLSFLALSVGFGLAVVLNTSFAEPVTGPPPAVEGSGGGSSRTGPSPVMIGSGGGTSRTGPAPALEENGAQFGSPPAFDPLLLNIRLTFKNLHPPAELIKESWLLEGYRVGRLGDAPHGAVIEDDQHQRLLILSATDDGRIRLYRLGELPVDIGRKLPAVVKCAQGRACQQRRMDPAGEMGCVALCLLETLNE
jgi:hypothetical protein